MTDIEMLPCPFCGGRADIVRGVADEEIWSHRAFSRVFCTRCQARQLFHKTDADAAAAWNTRANVAHATAAQDAEIEALKERDEKRGIYIREQWEEIEALRTDRDSFKQQAEHNLSLTERLAEALRDALEYLHHHLPDEALAPHRATLRDHDQEGGNP